jgi:hypothetical protein
MGRSKAKEDLNGVMDLTMKVTSKTELFMELESTTSKSLKRLIKGNFRMERLRDKVR